MHEVYKTILPGELVFDVGAHEGNKSAVFASRQCRIIAIEPQPKFAQILRERFHDNMGVQIKEVGIAAVPGRREMFISSNHPVLSTFSTDWMSGRFQDYKWEDRAVVEMTTLDCLIQEHGLPRYIKIDAEGLELEIIKGLSSKNALLSFEFTSEYLETAIEVLDRLSARGYSHFNFSVAEQTHLSLPKWITQPELISAIEQQKLADADLWGDIYAT